MISDKELKLLKQQCSVDFDDDDELLSELWESAEDTAVRYTERTRDELLGEDVEYPAGLRQAIRMLAAQYYRDREGSERPNALIEFQLRAYSNPHTR